jgi:hypothetical protein
MKRKHLRSTPETRAFGIQTVYRNVGPSIKAGFLRQAFAASVALALAFRRFTGSVNDAIKIAPEGAWSGSPTPPLGGSSK